MAAGAIGRTGELAWGARRSPGKHAASIAAAVAVFAYSSAHTFIVASLGGHVFERTSSSRTPIRKLWGPAVPAELVKDQSKAAFETTVAAELPARINYELGAILGGRSPPA